MSYFPEVTEDKTVAPTRAICEESTRESPAHDSLAKRTPSIPLVSRLESITGEGKQDSDEELLYQIRNQKNEALALLFGRHAALVRSVAYRILRDSFEADDLVQEVFLQISRKCREFDPSKGSAKAWILQIAYHLAISRRRFLKSRHFYTRVEIDSLEDSLSSRNNRSHQIDELLDRQAQKTTLLSLVETLSPNQRRTLYLFFFEDYTIDEIAEETGQSRGNVRHHYFRGLERLRKHFFPQHKGH